MLSLISMPRRAVDGAEGTYGSSLSAGVGRDTQGPEGLAETSSTLSCHCIVSRPLVRGEVQLARSDSSKFPCPKNC